MKLGILSSFVRENSINNDRTLRTSLEKISTGFKINKSSDDASGLAISDKLRTQASGIKQGIENANSAIALTQIADKSMGEISNILDTVKAKLIQANTDSTSDNGRIAIKKDIQKLLEQIDNTAKQTNYNGLSLLKNSGLDFQVGDSNQDIISMKDIYTNLEGLTGIDLKDYKNIPLSPADFDNYIQNETLPAPVSIDYRDLVPANPVTNSLNEAFSNNISLAFPDNPLRTDYNIELNRENFKLGNSPDNNAFSNISFRGPTYIEASDEDSKKYFEAFFKSLDPFNPVTPYSSGDGYFIPKEITVNLSDYNFDELLTKNQNIKFTTDTERITVSLSPYISYISGVDFTNTKINTLETTNPVLQLGITNEWFLDPNNLADNEARTGNSRLIIKDLKEMPEEHFTKEMAGDFQEPINHALNLLNGYRGEVGSTQIQLESSVRNSMTSYVNIKNAESIIRDVDYAEETANFNKSNIIAQAGSFTLSQATQVEQNYVAQLLK